ncbi:hypothetical protein [Allokutzneria sp. NRRL B-24872]|uniref:hypothetical protein n=1 Tax=Allokutzneria sp. NRRL B-24872 TaxID=1137961 RepID=UPI0011775F4D|nr:hypothetical protein [Allokutzneria sp. NRRL B-24872]
MSRNTSGCAINARRLYTGEPHRLAGRSVAATTRASTALQRSLALDTVSPRQHELEASILLAASRVSSVLYDRRRHSAYPLHYVVPQPERLELALAPGALEPLVFAMLPTYHEDNELVGAPGLRATPGRNGVTLNLLDPTGTPTDAQVFLRGVSRKDWAMAVAAVDARSALPSFVHEQRLSVHERRFLRRYPFFDAHPMLASAMLRRLHLLHSACWVSIWTADLAVKVEWCGGPSLREVTRLLTHPRFGLLGSEISLPDRTVLDDHRSLHSVTFQGPALPVHATWKPMRGFPEGALLLRPHASCHHKTEVSPTTRTPRSSPAGVARRRVLGRPGLA